MDFILQFQKLLAFPFHQLADRNPGPAAHDLANILLIDFLFEQGLLPSPLPEGCFLVSELLLEADQRPVLQFGCAVKVIASFGLLDLNFCLLNLLFKGPDTGDGLFLDFPLGLEGIGLGFEIGQFLFQFF